MAIHAECREALATIRSIVHPKGDSEAAWSFDLEQAADCPRENHEPIFAGVPVQADGSSWIAKIVAQH